MANCCICCSIGNTPIARSCPEPSLWRSGLSVLHFIETGTVSRFICRRKRRENERARARCPAAMALVRGGVARHDGHCDGSYLPKVSAWLPLNPSREPHTCNHNAPAFVESGRALGNRRLQPLRYLHDGSDCFRLERLPDGRFAPTGKRRLCTGTPRTDISACIKEAALTRPRPDDALPLRPPAAP